jgi:hypothetical protein
VVPLTPLTAALLTDNAPRAIAAISAESSKGSIVVFKVLMASTTLESPVVSCATSPTSPEMVLILGLIG